MSSAAPPWVSDPRAWGRIRLTEKMAEANHRAVLTYLRALRAHHHELPNPSLESREALDEIRELQKVLHNLEGLAEEKDWPWRGSLDGG